MSEQKDESITNQDVLNQIELLWKDWVEYEKNILSSIHHSISLAKSPIQNPCKLTKDEIIKYIKEVHKSKNDSIKCYNEKFDKLLNRTIKILNDNSIK